MEPLAKCFSADGVYGPLNQTLSLNVASPRDRADWNRFIAQYVAVALLRLRPRLLSKVITIDHSGLEHLADAAAVVKAETMSTGG